MAERLVSVAAQQMPQPHGCMGMVEYNTVTPMLDRTLAIREDGRATNRAKLYLDA